MIKVGKPNERKEVCKEEWEGFGTKAARHGAALGRHTRAAAVQGSNLAITVRAASHELGLSAAVFLLAGSPCERRRNHHTNFCGEPRDLVRAGVVGVTCQIERTNAARKGHRDG